MYPGKYLLQFRQVFQISFILEESNEVQLMPLGQLPGQVKNLQLVPPVRRIRETVGSEKDFQSKKIKIVKNTAKAQYYQKIFILKRKHFEKGIFLIFVLYNFCFKTFNHEFRSYG
jgi:hypothetical protein